MILLLVSRILAIWKYDSLTDSCANTGYISWAFKRIADKDAVAVRIFREAGAVFYVKTANPQTLLVSNHQLRVT